MATDDMAPSARRLATIVGELEDRLLASRELQALFRFGSARSFRRAASRGQIPIPVFRLAGRHGWFARLSDAQQWLQTAHRPERQTSLADEGR